MPIATLAAGALSTSDITLLLFSLGVLLGLARLMGEAARSMRLPAVVGEIGAGVVLGPTVLGAVSPEAYTMLFPTQGYAYIALESLFLIAAVLLLLIAGLEVELSTAVRQGKATLLVSVMGVLLPGSIGIALGWFAPTLLNIENVALVTQGYATVEQLRLPFALFFGVALSITALPVIAKVLIDLHLAKSDVGVLILASAMVNDLLGWIGFAMILAMLPTSGGGATAGGEATGLLFTIVLTVAFVIGMLTLGRWLCHKALPIVQAKGSWPGSVLAFVMTVALTCAALTEWLGVHAIFGAFIAGVAIGDSSHLHERTRNTIHDFIANIFAPLFFASIGLRVNFASAFDLQLVLVVLVVAILGKVIGCWLGARWAGLGRRESWAVGFGMVARGAMEIILAQLALTVGLIGQRLFVAIVVMAIVTSLIAGPLIERALRRRQRLTLTKMLHEKNTLLSIRSRTTDEAIAELGAVGARLAGLEPGPVIEAVLRRERIVPSGLEKGVAVPHARLPELDKPLIVLGRCREGIDFDARDGVMANLICLLLTPLRDETAQIQLLEAVATTLIDDAGRQRLLDAGSFTEFKAVLNQLETL